jgi:hypothetical protein
VSREVTLYTPRDRSLFDEAAAELRALSRDLRFEIRELDIDGDASLREQFDEIVRSSPSARASSLMPIVAGKLRADLEGALRDER